MEVKLLVLDNFFDNPDTIRSIALQQTFFNKEEHPGDIAEFPGMRTDYINNLNPELYEALVQAELNCVSRIVDINKYTEYWTKFSFSYTPKGVGLDMHRDFEEGWNGFNTFYGGVIYLNPEPPSNSGTIVEGEIVDNVYNRYVMYDATCLHGLQDSFGKCKEDSRLVLTHFIYLK